LTAPAAAPGPGVAPHRRLGAHLERLVDTFDARYLATDPISLVHEYRDPADIELFGFLASSLAYGRVDQILRSLRDLQTRIGPSPARFVSGFDYASGLRALRGFRHRFHSGRDVAHLCLLLRRALDDSGSLGAFFAGGFERTHDHVGPALAHFCERMTGWAGIPGLRGGTLPRSSPVRLFFSSPAGGSACKRLNLYLRWMVRRGAPDFGLWRDIPSSHLVIPLDTHVARLAINLGLTSRKTPDWRMALEVTAALRRYDPADPIRYDFALCRLGILDHCPRRVDPMKCAACMLRPVCTL
jgi:uncharacterized protein (TIGR02757 family)